MKKSRLLLVMISLILPLAFLGCDGDDGAQGPAGPPGPPGTAAPTEPPGAASPTETASESCDVCHGPNSQLLPMNLFHDAAVTDPVNDLTADITGVTFPVAPDNVTPTVDFTVTLNGAPFTTLTANRVSFVIAKLIPGVSGDPDVWQAYTNRTATPDGDPVPVIPDTVDQATTDSGGTFVNNGDGSYSYTFGTNLDNAAFPSDNTLVGYDPTLTHRVGMQFSPSDPVPSDVRFNTFVDVVPDGSQVVLTRNIATTASCLECHTESVIAPRWGFHGSGARVEVEYCVLCHNPGTVDPESGNTVDMATMIHKIHRGRELPSVVDNGSYIIVGHNDSIHDYSHVGYPQDIRNCEKCHDPADAATPDAGNYLSRPSIEACATCHDDISFVSPPPAGKVLHSGGAQASNAGCTTCHPATGAGIGQSVADAHAIPTQAEAAAFQFNVLGVDNTAPGEFPTVTFSVTNPIDNTFYDILADQPFTVGGGVSRLAVLIGWKTGSVGLGDPAIDWTNEGSGNRVGQPVSINPLAAGVATNNGDGTFSVTSPVAIPLQAEGTGIAALEGHPAGADNVARLPVQNAFLYFGITDTVPEPRRTVVNVAKCDSCHDQLSIHGSNRTDSIEVCVICHNPNATDIIVRPFISDNTALGVDGKREETIDFKNMIHAIHASGEGGGDPRTVPVVIYGFGGSVHDFAEVTYPGNMRKCTQCHDGTTWQLPLQTGILATTVNSPPDLADPDDDGNITKTAGVCSACHDAASIRAHMEAQGASFNVRQGNIIE